MPPFPERESSILAKLKKKKPASVPEQEVKDPQARTIPQAQISNNVDSQPPVQVNLISQVSYCMRSLGILTENSKCQGNVLCMYI